MHANVVALEEARDAAERDARAVVTGQRPDASLWSIGMPGPPDAASTRSGVDRE